MEEMLGYHCLECGKSFPWDTLAFRCECGGLFQVRYPETLSLDLVETKIPSMLRYRHAFPVQIQNALTSISLGEGWTAMVPRSAADPSVMVKMDYLMPTLSFKDRGAVVLVALAMAIGVDCIVQDSSGNAGHAVATYSARAGIPCEIYVPADCSPKKIAMIEAGGAKVNVIAGSREDTADATLQAASKPGTFYASHVYNPLFYEGTRTYVFEILEQLGRIPDQIVVPLGNGTLVLGVARALKELACTGIDSRRCQIIAVQAGNCAPIHCAYQGNQSTVAPIDNLGTVAEGIAIARPLRGAESLAAVRKSKGDIWVAEEHLIAPALMELRKLGFEVEATTAATFAAYDAIAKKENHKLAVLAGCGSGTKK